ncbi:MAG: hypothetical protein EXS16_21295 [Gemmataceae bacterium]|nr:hypothetical protein [Gemmataceae bacterium]
MYRLCLAICCGLALVGCLGCAAQPPNGPPPAANIKGTVTMDGKPVPTGEIHFELLGVGAAPGTLIVTDGVFSGPAPIGKNKVEVYIYVKGPPSDKFPDIPTKINTSPEKYWGPNSVLDANVEANGANQFKFDLTAN